MEKFFKEKVVLITGDISSLSVGIIHCFLKEMAIVIVPVRSFHQLEMVKSFRDIARYENLVTLIIDLHDFNRVTETCETITERFGKIDIAIQIPGFSNSQQDLTEASIDEWNNMMETDMVPFFIGARIVLNMMKDHLSSMFVHITDGSLLESPASCALARIAFSTRIEMSKIFAKEANRYGIRYYHLWAQNQADKENCTVNGISLSVDCDKISSEIMELYRRETYSADSALQFFPEQMLHNQL